MKRQLAIALLVTLLLTTSFAVMISPAAMGADLSSRIRIEGNDDLAAQAAANGWPGDGSASSPYLIAGLSIQATGDEDGVLITNTTEHIVIEGCAISGGDFPELTEGWYQQLSGTGCGICILDAVNITVRNNLIDGCRAGLIMRGSSDSMIENNVILESTMFDLCLFGSSNTSVLSNTIRGSVIGGAGVYLWESDSITVSQNLIEDVDCGLYLGYATNCLITGNTITASYDGIYSPWSSDNIISGNTITCSGQGNGIHMQFSSHCLIANNIFTNSSLGIWLEASSDHNAISDNRIDSQEHGVAVWQSSYNVITGNTISGSNLKIMVDAWSLNNTVLNNTLLGPSLEISLVNGAFINTASPTISWIGSDLSSEISSYGVMLDNGPWDVLPATVTSYTFNGLAEGAHTVTLSATDVDGYTLQIAVNFFVNSHLIHIDGDADLASQAASHAWPGDGSASSPYLISGLSVDATRNAYAIHIANTTSFVVIEGCTLSNAYVGIGIDYASHVSIRDNVVKDCYLEHIRVEGSKDVVISGNNISTPYEWDPIGIALYRSSFVIARDNNISGPMPYCTLQYGVYLDRSDNCSISSNAISGTYRGIELVSSSYNGLSGNSVIHSGVGTFLLSSSAQNVVANNSYIGLNQAISVQEGSDNNFILGNYINGCGGIAVLTSGNVVVNNVLDHDWGYYIESFGSDSTGNVIYQNSFISDSTVLVHGSDSDAWTYDSMGNYWSDWLAPDDDHDGIVDVPRPIAGSNNADYRPVTSMKYIATPSIFSISPDDGTSDVANAISVQITFSEAMDRASVESAFLLLSDGVSVPGTFEWSGNTILTFTPSAPLQDGSYNQVFVSVGAKDANGIPMTSIVRSSFTIKAPVVSALPTITGMSVPIVPAVIGNKIAATATFTVADAGKALVSRAMSVDVGAGETFSATWSWDDGTTSSGVIDEEAGTITGAHTYTSPGVYTVSLTITDSSGNSDTVVAQTYSVVYDPVGGFVTGGGYISSPAGAYKADPTLEGKATFGFVANYQKGASVPSGNTEFQFLVGNLNFHSSSYEWLVVNQGGTNAQFKGDGTINGSPAPNGQNYKFMIWAGDHDPDTFRIKIWWEDAAGEHVVYDNGVQQAISGGSIVIHTK